MKSRMILGVLFFCVLSLQTVFAQNKVIYGEDNRLDVYEATDSLHLELANSTAAQISNSSLKLDESGDAYTVTGGTLQSAFRICSNERFATQTAVARCSGFLVGPDLLVTAGHCITAQRDCDNYKWAFDYKIEDREQPIVSSLPKSSVYSCVSIIERVQTNSNSDDYALIKLDRVVEHKTPLTVRREGQVEIGANVVVIGHPTGLPTKISAGAVVRENGAKKYFVTNLDTFGGNSGSAVFDSDSGIVEGILVRGETDYIYDSAAGCQRPKKCLPNACRGEDVTRITNIKALMHMPAN